MANPISLPDIPWVECTFLPVRPRNTARMEGRRTESDMFATPYWKATYRSGWLEAVNYGVMDAFVVSVMDGETFIGYDAFRPRPILHDNEKPLTGVKALGGAFNGLADLDTINNSRSITVSGLPAGFQLSKGDYVEVRQSLTLRSLHMITAPATADASGIVTLAFKFGLDIQHFTTAAIVNFEKAGCIMELDPGSYEALKSWPTREPRISATEVFHE